MSRVLLLSTAFLAARVTAHGYIATFTLDGTAHEGFERWNENPDPKAIGWSYTTPDEGPVLDISSPDFVCRQEGAPSKNYGQIAAGGKADFFWTSADKEVNPDGWAESHHGPILTYIAPCGGDCTTVDKTALKWTKISEEGLISGQANVNGVWATDKMRANGGVNSATIPSSIAPGKYVIRNEIIALHRANLKEPEFYGQCGNIEITGSGTDDLANTGVVASQLYSTQDKIFGFDIYDGSDSTWPIPGPALYTAKNAPAQSQTSQAQSTQAQTQSQSQIQSQTQSQPTQTPPAQNQPVDDEPTEPAQSEPAAVQPAPTTLATRTRTHSHKSRPTGCGRN